MATPMTEMQNAILALMRERGSGKTCCPSEVARMVATPGENWRCKMADVHEAAAFLQNEHLIELTWKGNTRDITDGPYRIGMPGEPRQ